MLKIYLLFNNLKNNVPGASDNNLNNQFDLNSQNMGSVLNEINEMQKTSKLFEIDFEVISCQLKALDGFTYNFQLAVNM